MIWAQFHPPNPVVEPHGLRYHQSVMEAGMAIPTRIGRNVQMRAFLMLGVSLGGCQSHSESACGPLGEPGECVVHECMSQCPDLAATESCCLSSSKTLADDSVAVERLRALCPEPDGCPAEAYIHGDAALCVAQAAGADVRGGWCEAHKLSVEQGRIVWEVAVKGEGGCIRIFFIDALSGQVLPSNVSACG
jgi:hypothetical protein